jgi:hypothetical protein
MRPISRATFSLILLFFCNATLAIPIGPGETWEAPFDFSSQPHLLPITQGGISITFAREDSLDPGESFSIELLNADREIMTRFFMSDPLLGWATANFLDTPLYEAPTGYLQISSIGSSTFDPIYFTLTFSGESIFDAIGVLDSLELVGVASTPNTLALILIALAVLNRRAKAIQSEAHPGIIVV